MRARENGRRPLYISYDNAHLLLVELLPHLDKLGEFVCRIGDIQSSWTDGARLMSTYVSEGAFVRSC